MLSVVLVILALTANGQCEEDGSLHFTDHDPLSQEFIDYINSLNTTWKAGQNFPGKKEDDLKYLCGTLSPDPEDPLEPGFDDDPPLMDFATLPSNFDVRSKWPHCKSIVSMIGDQDDCGSCWVCIKWTHESTKLSEIIFIDRHSVPLQPSMTAIAFIKTCNFKYHRNFLSRVVQGHIITMGEYCLFF